MARQSANESKTHKKKKHPGLAVRNGVDDSAQDSEYRDLKRRVDARKDAKQIMKIAKMLESEP
jgi:hypothetical protein